MATIRPGLPFVGTLRLRDSRVTSPGHRAARWQSTVTRKSVLLRSRHSASPNHQAPTARSCQRSPAEEALLMPGGEQSSWFTEAFSGVHKCCLPRCTYILQFVQIDLLVSEQVASFSDRVLVQQICTDCLHYCRCFHWM